MDFKHLRFLQEITMEQLLELRRIVLFNENDFEMEGLIYFDYRLKNSIKKIDKEIISRLKHKMVN